MRKNNYNQSANQSLAPIFSGSFLKKDQVTLCETTCEYLLNDDYAKKVLLFVYFCVHSKYCSLLMHFTSASKPTTVLHQRKQKRKLKVCAGPILASVVIFWKKKETNFLKTTSDCSGMTKKMLLLQKVNDLCTVYIGSFFKDKTNFDISFCNKKSVTIGGYKRQSFSWIHSATLKKKAKLNSFCSGSANAGV